MRRDEHDDGGDDRLDLRLDDLPVGSMRMVRADGRRLCLVRTSDGVFALDHACPHEGYGLTQGVLDGNLLTCAWHNWKFRVDDGACVLGEEDVRTHPVAVAADGSLHVTVAEPDPAGAAPDAAGQPASGHRARLRRSGLPRRRPAAAGRHQPRRDGLGGRRPRRAPGRVRVGSLDRLGHRLPGHGRSLRRRPAGAADRPGHRRHRRGRARPAGQRAARPRPPTSGATPAGEFRRLVEAEQLEPAQALVRGAIHAGWSADELRPWFTGVVSDHLLSYGHGAIYSQKAFQLLDELGWERADTVLPHLVPTIVYGTREDTLPYMRPFTRAVAGARPRRARRRRRRPDVARRRHAAGGDPRRRS